MIEMSRVTQPPKPYEHHRDMRGGAIRAGVFGFSDGLVTNLALILGIAGAQESASTIRLAGVAGLIAGALSMAAGEFVSMAAQRDLLEHELSVERASLANHPEAERQELALIYQARGLSQELAERLSDEIMQRPELALEAHARDELGIDPRSLGSPVAAAASSLVTFAAGAVIPLLPWLLTTSTPAIVASLVLAGASAILVGGVIGSTAGRGPWRSALRQLVLGALAGGSTYAIGALVGARL